MKIIKATPEQKAEYKKTDPVYPLYGYIVVDGVNCVIEDLRGYWPKEHPQFEVIAPTGKIFEDEGLHNLLCFDLKDVKERTRGCKLVDCERPCEWCGAQ